MTLTLCIPFVLIELKDCDQHYLKSQQLLKRYPRNVCFKESTDLNNYCIYIQNFTVIYYTVKTVLSGT